VEIVLGEGIGALQFGMTADQLAVTLGQPDKDEADDYGDRLLQYTGQHLDCRLETNNQSRFVWVVVKNPAAKLFGKRLLGQPQANVVAFLTDKIGRATGVEDYGSFESYFFESVWLELQFTAAKLSSINFGVIYSDDDQPMFPMDYDRSGGDTTEYMPDPD
jgi:hypothetical protein